MKQAHQIQKFLSAGAIAMALSFPIASLATTIDPGFDLFSTGAGATVDLTAFGLGTVGLQGNPIGPGNTDTIVQRLDGITPFPTGGADTIDIELVALSLRSVSPVDLTPLGGPFIGLDADLFVTINKLGLLGLPQPNVLLPSIGRMEIRHEVAGGGAFDSCFGEVADCTLSGGALGVVGGGIFADAIFTVINGDPNNAGDILIFQPAAKVILQSQGTPWSHLPPPGDLHNAMFPAGDFYAAVDPATGESVPFVHVGPHPELFNAVPEPTTLILLTLGLAGIGFSRRKAM